MGEVKPSLCPRCSNYLLPWAIALLTDGYYLCRPCPRSDCGYMQKELVSRDGDGLNYWNGDYL